MTKANFTLKNMTQCCLGLLLMLALPILGFAQTTQTFSGAGLPTNVPPTGTSGTTQVTTNVTLNGVIGTNASIDDVAINLTHTFDGDLDIALISPAGTVMLLSGGNGGSLNDYLGTVFANGGNPCIESGSAPFTGTWEPEGGLTVNAEGNCMTDNVFATVFAGEEINGTWILNILDNFGGDSGEITQFDLTLTVQAPPVDPDCPFMPYDGEVGCIANVNVTLGANCTARITPQMVLTGANVACAENIFITVDGTNSDVISGCGTHTYVAEIYDAFDNLAYTCWGNVFAEDKTNPTVMCPENTDEIEALFNIQTLDGTISATDPSLELSDYSCFQSFFETVPGAYNYDLIEITINTTDVYNITVDGAFNDQLVVSVFSEFNVNNPCENILGGTEGAFANTQLGVANYFNSNFRIPLVLEAGRTYTIMVAGNDIPNAYTLGITSDNGNTVSAAGLGAPRAVDLNVPLYCGDLGLIRFQTPQNWIANADGTLNFNATRNTFFGGSTAALNAFLAKVGLTGFPVVGDNCGPVLVTLTDAVVQNGDCGTIVLTRTFRVADRYDGACIGAPRLASCAQTITFNRPSLDNNIFGDPSPFFVLPPYTTVIECDEYFETDGSVGGPDDNPTAQYAGEPFLLTASGYVPLDPTYCNIGANYSDEPRIVVCDGTYKFRREWNFINWCTPSENFTWNQYIKVGDFTGPEISGIPNVINVSTSPFSCLANVAIPCPTIVDGNGCSSVVGTTYTVLAFGQSFFAGGNLCAGAVVQAPIGEHVLIVCAEDDCGNETCEEYDLIVTDQIEPSASCDDQLNVSIGGGDVANGIEGIARVFATDVNEGSNDNCGEVTLEVRRNYWRNNTCDPSANRYSPWGPYVDFYCCDIDNEITIELRVTDESGNENI